MRKIWAFAGNGRRAVSRIMRGAQRSSPLLLLLVATLCMPAYADDVSGQNVHVDPGNTNAGTLSSGLTFGGNIDIVLPGIQGRPPLHLTPPTGTGISSNRAAGNRYGLDFYTPFFLSGASMVRMSITTLGRVGIGTIAPTRQLEVDGGGNVELGLKSSDAGGTLWTLQSTGVANSGPNVALNSSFQIVDRSLGLSRFEIDKTGLVSVNALEIKGGSDIAEPFESASPLEAGSVVVIDEATPGRLKQSDHAYDRKVAGIVSGGGGVNTGLTLIQLAGDGPRNSVALSGRAYALADTSSGPISPGDFLTTSAVPGHAMKAANLRRARGAILGKAMTPLKAKNGVVLVLVGLQ